MNTSWFAAPEWVTLVQALLHTLWQAALAAGALFLILRAVPSGRANLRYALSAGALALVLMMGVATWALLDNAAASSAAPRSRSSREAELTTPALPISSVAYSNAGRTSKTETHQPLSSGPSSSWPRWAAAFWLAGVAVCLGRAVRGVIGVGRLRRRCRDLTDPHILALAEGLCSRLRLARRVRFLVSEEIGVPAAMGALFPAVLLPAAMLCGVPTEQLRAILAHELAHLRRWDYLVNLWQMLVEALLFFNPFAWWISHQMRIEREACCDQLAVGECQSPVQYVEALAAVLERQAGSGLIPAGALAATGPDQPHRGGVLDRARRLLVPGYLPALRLRWFSLALVVAFSGLALSALWWGARAAARVLTPRERIERITEIKKQNDPPAYEKGEITVSGVVMQEDGSPPAGPVWVQVSSRIPQSTGSTFVPTHGGEFSARIQRGVLSMAVSGDNYPPVFLGPLDPNKQSVENLRLVLKPGFPASIQVTDENGKPIPGVKLTGYYNGILNAGRLALVTDAAGTASIAHAGADPVLLTATAPGYQVDELKDIRLKADEPFLWMLKKAQPFRGTVVSAATGQVVAGAKIKQAAMHAANFGGSVSDPETASLLATSDAQGKFALDTLRAGAVYDFYVEAPGYGGVLVNNVRPRHSDQRDMKVALGPELLVRGKITNIPESDAGNPQTIAIYYSQQMTVEGSSSSHGRSRSFPVVNGSADFTLGPLYAAPLEINVAGQSVRLTAEELASAAPRIDLANRSALEKSDAHPKREVVVHFAVPKNAPPPTGSIKATYLVRGFDGDPPQAHEYDVPLKAGAARLEVRTPNKITFESSGLVGYFFAGSISKEVPVGEGPLTVDVPVQPAGVIYGEVVEEGGQPSYGLMISALCTTKGADQFPLPTVKDSSYGNQDTQNRFAASPLPFGGTYAIVAHRDATYAVSAPLRVDQTDPIRHVKIVLPKGRTVHGRVTADDGSPAAGMALHLDYRTPWENGFGGSAIWTDGDGRFTIPGVNFAAPGQYSISIPSKAGFQPAKKTLDPREALVDIRLRRGKILTGIVVDSASGDPVAGAEVFALYADVSILGSEAKNPTPGYTYFDAESRTDEQGRFRFSNLPNATMKLNTRSCSLVEPWPVPASPGQSEPVRLSVKLLPGSEARAVPPK
jgi:beta-lactamase regulating signal transducer with metallopeptidase domain